ncbi:hypothetical protein LJB94_03210 [Odoribacter sp. OttesenSCG-928-G04]|nr:hypothetical protein [Odoribacter sp. OttesenSCG-928-G04]MDL2331286.1 hypothetical protein [Odoribacter sp. OttesenSCG-928-A06]
MKKILTYWDCLLLIWIPILYFFTAKGILPHPLYTVLSVAIAFAILSGKLLWIKKAHLSGTVEKSFYISSNCIVVSLIALTIIYLNASGYYGMNACALILRLLNIACLLYFICRNRQKEAIFCLCGLLLPDYGAI